MRPVYSQAKNNIVRLLRWSERYTKTDMVYATSGGFWLFLGYSIQIVSGLVLAVLFANILPKEAFGTYQFIISMAAIVSVFTLTGMGGAIIRSAAQGESRALSYGFKIQMVWNVGIVLASATLSLYYFINENHLLGTAFLIVGTFQPFITGFGLCKSYLHGKKLFRESTIIDILGRFIPFVALVITLFVSPHPLSLIIVYFSAHACTLFISFMFVVNKYETGNTNDVKIKSYSKHLSVMESFGEIAAAIDKVFVWTFLGAAPTAVYALAQMPVLHLQSMFGLMRILAFPKIAQRPFAELKQTLPYKIRNYFLVTLFVVIAYIIAAPYIFALFFPQYLEAVSYSQALALLVLAVPRTFISQAFLAHGMKRELYIINITGPGMRIALLGALLPLYGIWGAVIALLLSELVITGIQWYLFKKASVQESPSLPIP